MTATIKAVPNGSKTTAPAEPERKSGMAYVREAEAYHLASLAHDAAFEGERICNTLSRQASETYLRSNDAAPEPESDTWAREGERSRLIDEAARCLDTAQHYLRSLLGDPPF